MNTEKRQARVAGRFWSKVEKTGECWNWTASAPNTYGQFWWDGTYVTAHRAALTLSGVAVPSDMQVDHLCRNRLCVRPDHLEIVTPAENNRRSTSPSAINVDKTECPQGHPYDEVNTYLYRGRRRHCRECMRQRWNRRYGSGRQEKVA